MRKPFVVIIGAARTSTTLISEFCNNHPDLHPVYGEIFNPDLFQKNAPKSKHKDMQTLVRDVCGIEKYFWDTAKQESLNLDYVVTEVLNYYNGFKICYGQLARWSAVWRRLQTEDAKILHVHRWNLLERMLSKMLAGRSNTWNVKFGKLPPEDDPVTISPNELDETFYELYTNDIYYSMMFNSQTNPNVLDIQYEEVYTWKRLVKKMEAFLGVSTTIIPPPLRKRTVKKPCELITNYWELKETFQGTPWGVYFQD